MPGLLAFSETAGAGEAAYAPLRRALELIGFVEGVFDAPAGDGLGASRSGLGYAR
ncbi:MAG: hypothetical protein HQL57_03145 [Magnetococcales bacterium]|nr:hypothetical protein [Magnetococcales bacterium]MBF0156166.1 hypothetical protein [Magnetococcales bacterium]